MKYIIFFLGLFFAVGCQSNQEKQMKETKDISFFVGTYTDGESKGIYKYNLKADGKLEPIGLAAVTDNPSFLAVSSDNKFLVSISEVDRDNVGNVESFLISRDTLSFIDRSSSGGAHPCFVAIDDNGYVLTANYTGGNIGLLKIDNEGLLSDVLDIQQHVGSGGTERQKSPHAHSVWFEPETNNIIAVDLGTNELHFSQLDKNENKITDNPTKIAMKQGAGPRHLAFHPNHKWLYVVNELDCTVTLLNKSDDGSYKVVESISTLPTDYTEPNTCADIRISSDGDFLYASNRGHNSIAIFSINENGNLSLVGFESTRGDGPRNFSLSPDDNYLLVANQRTNNIVSFKRDKKTGLLNFVSEVEALTPVCIVF
jgi:6-phosphogluconolactonase